jgi:hypothetical protein
MLGRCPTHDLVDSNHVEVQSPSHHRLTVSLVIPDDEGGAYVGII